eukprot:711497-Rhodomonas_salina.2
MTPGQTDGDSNGRRSAPIYDGCSAINGVCGVMNGGIADIPGDDADNYGRRTPSRRQVGHHRYRSAFVRAIRRSLLT